MRLTLENRIVSSFWKKHLNFLWEWYLSVTLVLFLVYSVESFQPAVVLTGLWNTSTRWRFAENRGWKFGILLPWMLQYLCSCPHDSWLRLHCGKHIIINHDTMQKIMNLSGLVVLKTLNECLHFYHISLVHITFWSSPLNLLGSFIQQNSEDTHLVTKYNNAVLYYAYNFK